MTPASAMEAMKQTDICSPGMVRRVAAMLDLDPAQFNAGDLLPRGWHFLLLGGETRRSDLRADGFPGFGVPIPDVGLPRLMFAGRNVAYRLDLTIGAPVYRCSVLRDVTHKSSASGDIAIVTIGHELRSHPDAEPAVVEDQTFILLGKSKTRQAKEAVAASVDAENIKVVEPDETMLFQFSALGFNSHKIHLERSYAQDVEGLPDLVVNGGLSMLLMTEFLRVDLGTSPSRIRTKHTAPLYCGRPLTLAADKDANGWRMRAHDHSGALAVEAEVHIS